MSASRAESSSPLATGTIAVAAAGNRSVRPITGPSQATIINGEGQALDIAKGKGKDTTSVDIGGLDSGCPHIAEATANFP
jgi:hypothetical protein